MAMGKDDEPTKGMTPQQHRQWALALWKRMDRDNNQEMTLDELNCSEFLEALRTILTPAMASKSVGSYARAEINLTQVLHHCLKMADTNRDGTLSFQEFERFLKNLRKPKHPTELALLYEHVRRRSGCLHRRERVPGHVALFYGPQSKIGRVSISLVPDGYRPSWQDIAASPGEMVGKNSAQGLHHVGASCDRARRVGNGRSWSRRQLTSDPNQVQNLQASSWTLAPAVHTLAERP